jgi:hypothetical protein
LTADLLDQLFPAGTPLSAGRVFTAGDNAYEDGTDLEFGLWYEPNWGRHKGRTRPVPGNHDYHTPGAAGYYEYFDAAAGDPSEGWYAYDLGGWRIYALNSNCSYVSGCDTSSPQYAWLQADLDATTTQCQVAYWHHARFSSGDEQGSDPRMSDVWGLLVSHAVELAVVAHDHVYERFAALDASGAPDPMGTREFVVGTGGGWLYGFGPPEPGSEVRHADTYGVMELRLFADRYEWEFHPVQGKTFTDRGGEWCR